MAGPKLDYLGKIREQDEQKEGEASPEKESLNPERVRKYLDDNGYTADNFDDRFNLNSALELLRLKRTRGEAVLEDELLKGKAYIDKIVKEKGNISVAGPVGTIGLSDLFEDTNPDTFRSTIHKELDARNELKNEPQLVEAHAKYHTIRKLAKRSLMVKKQFEQKREDEKIDAQTSLKDQFMGVVGDVKKNFSKMSGKEKLLTVGALLVGAVWLSKQSDNPKVQAVKDYVWSGVKYLGIGIGVAYGASQVHKLLTGKSGFDALDDSIKSSAASEGFWTDTYKTNAEGAAALQKSSVYIGDKNFPLLARKYREAKAAGKQEIHLPTVMDKDISPAEIYVALDTFNSRYPMDKLEKRYKDSKWIDVVAMEMAEDGRLEFNGNVAERAADAAREKGIELWNWLMVGEGLGVSRYLYKKVYGKESGNDDDTRTFIKEYFANDTATEAGLDKFIEGKFPVKESENFKKVLHEGDFDKDHDLKYKEVAGDSMYVIADVHLDNILENNKAAGDALKTAEDRTTDFLKKKYPSLGENVSKFILRRGGTRLISNSTFKFFVRMPLKGSVDFEQINAGQLKPADIEQRRNVEIFGMENKIVYAEMASQKQSNAERLRARFLLDSTQPEELEKICDWFTRKYQTKNMTIKSVYEQLFTNNDDRRMAIEETKVKQGLLRNGPLVESLESDISDIEKRAAKDVKGNALSFDQVIEEMRNGKGYKIRLAILGDTAARAALNYSSTDQDAQENLLSQYKADCEAYVESRNQGIVA